MDKAFKVVLVVLAIGLVSLLTGSYIASGLTVTTDAMKPALRYGDLVYVSRSGVDSAPARGSIVLFHVPRQEGLILRRVIGVPGDSVRIDKGDAIVNGEKLDESYRVDPDDVQGVFIPPDVSFGPVDVPPGAIFVLADDRFGPADSRDFGTIPLSNVTGKLLTLFGTPLTF